MSVEAVAKKRLTPAPPEGTYLGMPAFPKAAKEALHDHQMRQNLRHATTTIREKRLLRAAEVSNWQDLRTAGEQIKNKLSRNLDTYLLQAEEAMTKAGITVHWARDAAEANQIVVDIAKAKQTEEVVKIKSMATQEIELNEALEEAGVAAWETDLAELIVQFGHDRPSHILVPAIHRNRSEVREIFREEMGLWGKPAPEDLSDNPPDLAGAARAHLREKFLRAKVAVSGGNFIVAETGTLVIVESEGNGRMCLTLPETLISVVGIEKLVPTFDDLEVFLRLLPRSSTAERMNPYTSMWTGVTEGDGPQDLHVILLDNGRTNVLADPVGRAALRCIRCSACMNVCPVYERVGGHSYGSVYPGPIGAILTPQLRGISSAVDKSLPFASSLCGACDEVCPVKIPISDILVHMRSKVVEKKTKNRPTLESMIFSMVGKALENGDNLAFVEKFSKTAGRVFKKRTHFGVLPFPVASSWANARDLPVPAKETFRDWWDKRESEEKK
ncbi:MAG: LutB/LldF family L-lactate oxidation iron-sulfur protein [Tessaracoccus sp.]